MNTVILKFGSPSQSKRKNGRWKERVKYLTFNIARVVKSLRKAKKGRGVKGVDVENMKKQIKKSSYTSKARIPLICGRTSSALSPQLKTCKGVMKLRTICHNDIRTIWCSIGGVKKPLPKDRKCSLETGLYSMKQSYIPPSKLQKSKVYGMSCTERNIWSL